MMKIDLKESNLAIVGGGKACKAILQIFLSENFIDQRPKILGVAGSNDQAEGIRYAKEKGIFTTQNYTDLYRFEDLNLIIELTKDIALREKIEKTKPQKVRLIDHFEAMSVWNYLQIEEEKTKALKNIQKNKKNVQKIAEIFDKFSSRIAKIVEDRTDHLL